MFSELQQGRGGVSEPSAATPSLIGLFGSITVRLPRGETDAHQRFLINTNQTNTMSARLRPPGPSARSLPSPQIHHLAKMLPGSKF